MSYYRRLRTRKFRVLRRSSSCGSKLRHPNYWSAMQHARKLEKLYREPISLSIYPCVFCSALHVGSNRRVNRALRALEKKLVNTYFVKLAPATIVKDTQIRYRTLLRLYTRNYYAHVRHLDP